MYDFDRRPWTLAPPDFKMLPRRKEWHRPELGCSPVSHSAVREFQLFGVYRVKEKESVPMTATRNAYCRTKGLFFLYKLLQFYFSK